jgi:Protein of unknown function (DUF3431)
MSAAELCGFLQDTSWLDVYLSEIPHIIYEEERLDDSPAALYTTIANKGNEAMAYLQFIIDFYDRLPQNVLFIHGNRQAANISYDVNSLIILVQLLRHE